MVTAFKTKSYPNIPNIVLVLSPDEAVLVHYACGMLAAKEKELITLNSATKSVLILQQITSKLKEMM